MLGIYYYVSLNVLWNRNKEYKSWNNYNIDLSYRIGKQKTNNNNKNYSKIISKWISVVSIPWSRCEYRKSWSFALQKNKSISCSLSLKFSFLKKVLQFQMLLLHSLYSADLLEFILNWIDLFFSFKQESRTQIQ